jgi:hypothetical protein
MSDDFGQVPIRCASLEMVKGINFGLNMCIMEVIYSIISLAPDSIEE